VLHLRTDIFDEEIPLGPNKDIRVFEFKEAWIRAYCKSFEKALVL